MRSGLIALLDRLQIPGSTVVTPAMGLTWVSWRPVVFGLACLLISPCFALDSSQDLSQVAHTSWLTQDGFFKATPFAISQDSNGYLWIGTTSGINLFDGARFSQWSGAGMPEAAADSVNALFSARDGSMWIAGSRLYQLKNGQITTHFSTGRVNQIAEGTDGTIFISRSRIASGRNPLCAIRGAQEKCYGAADGIPFTYADPLVADHLGNIWIGSSTQVLQWRDDKAPIVYGPPNANLKSREGLAGFTALVERPSGGIWAGFHQGLGFGLQELVAGGWRQANTPGLDTTKLGISKLFVDREDSLWIGTFNQGVYRISGAKVEHFGHVDGLSGDDVNDIFEDREKNVWVATSKGIDRFRNLPIINFSLSEGLSSDGVESVLASRDGTIWIGNNDGLDALIDGQPHANLSSRFIERNRVTSLMEDREGRLWVGSGISLLISGRKKVSRVTRPDGLPIGVVVAMAQDTDGDVWIIRVAHSESSLLRVSAGIVREEFTNGQMSSPAESLVADPESGIWIGLSNGRLGRYQHGIFHSVAVASGPTPAALNRIAIDPNGGVAASTSHGFIEWRENISHRLSEANGLPCDDFLSFVFDSSDALWLYAKCGVIRISREDLASWWRNPDAEVPFKHWDSLDGAEPKATAFSPSATRSADGRLWFANGNVVQMIDPRHIIQNPRAPAVFIEQMTADRTDYPSQKNISLPPKTRDIEFGFTATSLSVPQKVQFKYKLDGYDDTWHAASNRRQAYYANLPPGRYRFHVIASNEDGVWNEKGASMDFAIGRAWYQTIWFVLASLAVVTSLGVLAYRLRILQVRTSLLARFDDRLAERTRLAQELHDTLLQTIQASKLVASDALDRPSDLSYMLRSMNKLSEWLTRAMEEGRTALNSLRSPTTQTAELLREFNREIEHCVSQNRLDTVVFGPSRSRELKTTAFVELTRIGCEAIRNAFSHSGGTKLEISLHVDSGVVLTFEDDGKGIDQEILLRGKSEHYGLQGMRERAARIGAQLVIRCLEGRGTSITVTVPERLAFSERNYRMPSRGQISAGRVVRGSRPPDGSA